MQSTSNIQPHGFYSKLSRDNFQNQTSKYFDICMKSDTNYSVQSAPIFLLLLLGWIIFIIANINNLGSYFARCEPIGPFARGNLHSPLTLALFNTGIPFEDEYVEHDEHKAAKQSSSRRWYALPELVITGDECQLRFVGMLMSARIFNILYFQENEIRLIRGNTNGSIVGDVLTIADIALHYHFYTSNTIKSLTCICHLSSNELITKHLSLMNNKNNKNSKICNDDVSKLRSYFQWNTLHILFSLSEICCQHKSPAVKKRKLKNEKNKMEHKNMTKSRDIFPVFEKSNTNNGYYKGKTRYNNNLILLSDFLTDSYNIGGEVSFLSLKGVFILITKYHLNYPQHLGGVCTIVANEKGIATCNFALSYATATMNPNKAFQIANPRQM